ncbi:MULTISPECIES: tetratricopeptide repeat protein [Sphingopyxis]|uniref:tetratricopeptide repeat protein n=1 Tax=Sphingopyxis TaxID=165697 RepID=UPI001C75A4BF|nr:MULTISPECIES: tetratricopeptide repeat protein [Sphingopyxis]QXF11800.1 tetratricopeptide repeat protein [Sphingopyxis terrae subsp. terrae]
MIALTAAPVAQAQDAGLDKRVERLEKEMRAVQRSVFPGGSPAFFEGEIAPDNTAGERAKGNAPVIDLTARVDALEAQLQTLTGQTEQNSYQLRELEKQFAAYKAEMENRLAAPAIGGETPASLPLASGSGATKPATVTQASTTTTTKKPSTTPTASKPDANRLALVKKVEIPATGNEAEDAYTYGFRLWDAKLYPEAQAQLKQVVAKWPKSNQASYAQNLLGRAYLDEGKPSLAAVAFYNNYKDRPSGPRAPHSLMYMGVALDKLGRKADACKAFRELDEVYGDKAPKDVRDDAAAAKAKAGC